MKRHLHHAAFLAATLFCISHSAEAGVVLMGTRVIYDGAKAEVVVQISNQGKHPALVQSWIDDGRADATPEQLDMPFLLTPPLARLEPGFGQSLRLRHLAAGVQDVQSDRESIYYLNVLEIPPAPTEDDIRTQNMLQLAVRSRIKLFYRPVGLKGRPRDAAASLHWSIKRQGTAYSLVVSNPSSYHVTIARVDLGNDASIDATMVAPQGEERFQIDENTARKVKQLRFAWIDDYGADQELTAEVAQ